MEGTIIEVCQVASLEVDGGINDVTAVMCKYAGANVLVAGSYVFGAENVAEAIAKLKA